MFKNKNQKDDEDLKLDEIVGEIDGEVANFVPNNTGFSPERTELTRKILLNIRANLDKAINLLSDDESGFFNEGNLVAEKLAEIGDDDGIENSSGKIVEGVFDGQNMVGADGNIYPVPANYASKSKLVEGDILKLTIDRRGNFVFKQIGPIDRDKIVAKLMQDLATRQYYAAMGNKKWKLLTAAVTYFKGEPGDEVVILIPKNGKSKWAAVENIVKG